MRSQIIEFCTYELSSITSCQCTKSSINRFFPTNWDIFIISLDITNSPSLLSELISVNKISIIKTFTQDLGCLEWINIIINTIIIFIKSGIEGTEVGCLTIKVVGRISQRNDLNFSQSSWLICGSLIQLPLNFDISNWCCVSYFQWNV